jgi:hypothetical protein
LHITFLEGCSWPITGVFGGRRRSERWLGGRSSERWLGGRSSERWLGGRSSEPWLGERSSEPWLAASYDVRLLVGRSGAPSADVH